MRYRAKVQNPSIKISLTISENKSVVFQDNCSGIVNFDNVVNSIGDSDKKNSQFTNGQFGFGIYSFIAFCKTLEIRSQNRNEEYSNCVKIPRSVFEKRKLSDIDVKPDTDDKLESTGTNIKLSGFDASELSKVNIEEVTKEVEHHFELLLKRKNLQILLIDRRFKSPKEHICVPYDYEKHEGQAFSNRIKDVMVTKYNTPKLKKFEKSIHVYLMITKQRVTNRPPVFFIKDRRITAIKDAAQFNSTNKKNLWEHPNISGYIDLKDLVEPDITRKSFSKKKNGKDSEILDHIFEAIKQIEPAILQHIKEINKVDEDEHYSELEDRLNSHLAKMSKQFNLLFRTNLIKGKNRNALPGEDTVGDDKGGSHHRDGISDDPTPIKTPGGKNSGSGEGDDEKGIGGDGEDQKPKEPENPFDDTGFTGSESKKPGFNIKIIPGPRNIDDTTGKEIKSDLIGGDIRIWREHKSFESRVSRTNKDQPKITQRLISYISGQIMVHFADEMYTKETVEDYGKHLFVTLTDLISEFEDGLKSYDGKNLSNLE